VSDDDWTPRPDAWTVLVTVTADRNMADRQEYWQWMSGLEQAIGATERAFSNDAPWVVGLPSSRHGRPLNDHFGFPRWDAHPYANVWQRIEGVASVAMATAWAAIHLVDPLDRAGYSVSDVSAYLTDEMVFLA